MISTLTAAADGTPRAIARASVSVRSGRFRICSQALLSPERPNGNFAT
jgi:hypothetical protein